MTVRDCSALLYGTVLSASVTPVMVSGSMVSVAVSVFVAYPSPESVATTV